jgi:hypothetical protein
MGQDTIMLEWKAILDTLNTADVQDQEGIFQELRKQEKYMVTKGFQFTFDKVISPTGETLWQRSH